MSNISVGVTPPNTVKYPLHRHDTWEVMYYLSGKGYLDTMGEKIPFEKGSIIIVPPNIMHGSVSENGFVNISISGDFNNLFFFPSPVKVEDDTNFSGEKLATMMLNNTYLSKGYLSSLSSAFAHFLLEKASFNGGIKLAVERIISKISENYLNTDFNVTPLLNQSGYAEDYIRAEFKKLTSLTPTQFVLKMRIDRAKKLFEIYGTSLSVSDVALSCGFDDVVYFSKRFKQVLGVSPNVYRNK
jgi:AraC-like DNA-binding protein